MKYYIKLKSKNKYHQYREFGTKEQAEEAYSLAKEIDYERIEYGEVEVKTEFYPMKIETN